MLDTKSGSPKMREGRCFVGIAEEVFMSEIGIFEREGPGPEGSDVV